VPEPYHADMAFDFPDDLVQLQRDFLAAEDRWREAAARGDDEAVGAAYRAAHDAALALHRHPWWDTTETRYQARMALREVAGRQ
jgi:hypothetical protein